MVVKLTTIYWEGGPSTSSGKVPALAEAIVIRTDELSFEVDIQNEETGSAVGYNILWGSEPD